MKNRAYIGTFTQKDSVGIYLAEWEAGELRITGEMAADNPAYLTVDGTTLYATLETEAGRVASYDMATDGTLTCTGEQSAMGASTCHICVDGANVFAANYNSGSIGVWTRDAQGALSTAGQAIVHCGSSIHPRQATPHAHQCVVTPDGAYLAVCDLGMDAVLFYPRTTAGIVVPPERTALPPGAGPRHSVYWPDGHWAVVGELSCEVYVYQGYGASAKLVQQLSTLRPGDAPESSACAALRLSPDMRSVLATTRGADTLSVFQVDEEGLLCPPITVSTQARWPRDAAFTPDGQHIICACEHEDCLTVFELTDGEPRYMSSVAVPTPTCVCFVD